MDKPQIAAMRGRNPKNSSDRTVGAPTEQRLEFNENGVSNTLTSVQKDNLVVIAANTKKGFEEVGEGDSINFSVPNSATRRGRVGKWVAQTLDTAYNQGVIQINPCKESGGKQPYQQNRIYDSSGISPALNSQITDQYKTNQGMRIRRLTEIECERLQGLPDNHTKWGMYPNKPVTPEEKLLRRKDAKEFERQQFINGNTHKKEISGTQRYKLCGNGVSIPPVLAITTELKELNY